MKFIFFVLIFGFSGGECFAYYGYGQSYNQSYSYYPQPYSQANLCYSMEMAALFSSPTSRKSANSSFVSSTSSIESSISTKEERIDKQQEIIDAQKIILKESFKSGALADKDEVVDAIETYFKDQDDEFECEESNSSVQLKFELYRPYILNILKNALLPMADADGKRDKNSTGLASKPNLTIKDNCEAAYAGGYRWDAKNQECLDPVIEEVTPAPVKKATAKKAAAKKNADLASESNFTTKDDCEAAYAVGFRWDAKNQECLDPVIEEDTTAKKAAAKKALEDATAKKAAAKKALEDATAKKAAAKKALEDATAKKVAAKKAAAKKALEDATAKKAAAKKALEDATAKKAAAKKAAAKKVAAKKAAAKKAAAKKALEDATANDNDSENNSEVLNARVQSDFEVTEKIASPPPTGHTCSDWKKYFDRKSGFSWINKTRYFSSTEFCKYYAKDKKKCKTATKKIFEAIKKIRIHESELEKLENRLSDAENRELERLIGTSEETEAGAPCFECLEELRALGRPTTGQTIGNLATMFMGVGLGYMGQRAGQSAQREVNELRAWQGFEPQNNFGSSLAGIGIAYPFISQGLYGLSQNNSSSCGSTVNVNRGYNW